MIKKYILLLLILLTSVISVGQNEDAWVYFKNKPNEASFMSNPLQMLTQRALDRRIKYNISLDTRDVPIESSFVAQINNSEGITILARSKWLNALHIQGSESNIRNLEELNFVDRVEFANKSIAFGGKESESLKLGAHYQKFQAEEEFEYGEASNQIEMMNGQVLHEDDFTGKGMQIAVIDAGFPNVDNFEAFKRIRDNQQILGGYNFVERTEDFYTGGTHGTAVLSTIAGYVENEFVGTAPDASFYLFISEDMANETPLEESLWVEAAEKADSLGVDVLNTSLGYYTFDNPNYDYTYNDLNGKTTFISRGAEIAFSRGMIVVNSAGNEGNKEWKYIIAPADSEFVLSIGAVNSSGSIASFSSFGPTFDGRLKPDVCAQGVGAAIIDDRGNISLSNGTSFASPILAGLATCLWQAFPDKNNKEIVQLIKESGHLYSNPTYQEGFGIPNFDAIYDSEKEDEVTELVVYPNPTKEKVHFKIPSGIETIEVSFMNFIGQTIYSKTIERNVSFVDISFLESGIYMLQVQYDNSTEIIKIIKH